MCDFLRHSVSEEPRNLGTVMLVMLKHCILLGSMGFTAAKV